MLFINCRWLISIYGCSKSFRWNLFRYETDRLDRIIEKNKALDWLYYTWNVCYWHTPAMISMAAWDLSCTIKPYTLSYLQTIDIHVLPTEWWFPNDLIIKWKLNINLKQFWTIFFIHLCMHMRARNKSLGIHSDGGLK